MICVQSRARVSRLAARLVTDEYLDLYTLAVIALVVAVLGILGIADIKTLAAAILLLLAVLAYSQVRSRRHIAQIVSAQRAGPLSAFRREFPDDLNNRRATASCLLLIGLSMTRTVQGGSLTELRLLLRAGGKIRVLLLDPTNDELVRAASDQRPQGITPDRLRRRIQGTLDELTDLKAGSGGDLEIRVASFIPPMGINAIDPDSDNGVIVLQHYEHRPDGEAAPIFCLTPADRLWYARFAAEAKRIWEDGTPWPLPPAQALRRARRPLFQSEFGPELENSLRNARDQLITGITRNTLFMSNYSKFEDSLRGGCKIRVVLADPTSDAVAVAAGRYYAERSPDSMRERIRHTLRLLAELHRSSGGDLTVRLTSRTLASGVISVDGRSQDACSGGQAMFIEYYSYQARGEPKFVLQPDDEWFDHFRQEAEALWDSATAAS
jgi:Domain of unknown function (DUF5919)